MLKRLSFAGTLLWRELKTGEWIIVALALLLSVAAITTLHFYTDRLMRGLDKQSAKFLGGDLVISSPTPIPVVWRTEAIARGLRTAEVWSYPSVVRFQDKFQLINIQAVSENYPLLSDVGRPAAHTAWVEPRLLQSFDIQLNASIIIGAAHFAISKILSSEIDTLNTGLGIAPTVMITLVDVPATKTVLPGSRVDYRLLLVGNKSQLANFEAWVNPKLTPGQRLLTVRNQRLGLRNTLQQTHQYLQLVLLITITLGGVAIGLSTQQYLRKHFNYIALCRCLGAKERQLAHVFLWQLCIIALVAGLLGVVLGYIAQTVLVELFKDYLRFPLPPASFMPAVVGVLVSVFLLFSFAYPVITQLPKTSPLFIWRSELAQLNTYQNRYFVITVALLILIFEWITHFSVLTLLFSCILLISIAILYMTSHVLLWGLKKIVDQTQGTLRRGISHLLQFPYMVSLQITSLSLIFILLIVLHTVKNDMLAHWQQSLPTQAPNYFAFNIAATDLPQLQQLFTRHQIPLADIYPMVRGRLVALNDRPILQAVSEAARSHNALHRELNLSWMWQYPADNKVVAGKMWTKQLADKAQVSVEENVALELGLKLGDKLTFQIADKQFSSRIMNIRSLEWLSFHPNFYMIFPPGLLQGFAETYITSFYLPANRSAFANTLLAEFPNVTVIDVANLLAQIQNLISKIALAIEYLFLFVGAVAILVVVASVQVSVGERRKTYQLLRTLGASRRYIFHSILVEISILVVLVVTMVIGLGWLGANILINHWYG